MQAADEPDEPAEALALLGPAAALGDVVADVLDLVVSDRGRNQIHVLAAAAAKRVDHVGEQAEAGRQQLSRPRAAALDVPLEREALLDQIVDVLPQNELVDRVVLEGAPDEERSAAANERADGKEVHVDAAGRVVRRMPVLVEGVLQHEMIEVRLVGREKDDRIPLRERVDLAKLGAIVVKTLAVAAGVEQSDEVGGEVDHIGAVRGGDLAQIARRSFGDPPLRLADRPSEHGDTAAKCRPGENLFVNEARHFVPRAAQAPLRALERELGLADDELGEARRGIHAAGLLPAG